MFGFLLRLISKPDKKRALGARPSSSPRRFIFNWNYVRRKAVRLLFEGKSTQEVAWRDIDLIAICIEDELLPFPYWYVGNKDNLLRNPNNAAGGKKLFFDGFSERVSGYKSDATFKTMVEASAATEGSFIAWRAPDAAET